ncbi:32 KDA HEAT SHOCK PROTEIN-RELATED [Salix purpurea]|uniref:32 kDa HEAT SHOCK PROTEIN-RELATED n=1 Tax=Salix purpurea TaxID=77065 RepID=A0A9Q0WEG7_SALPP|nr:32 KDA HEAT SHOCK PROTEIN-RELATED [Salix purpurea]
MSSMEFWGVEVKAGEPLKVEPKDFYMIHLSQAALGESSKKGNDSVPLFLKFDEKKLVLGTLSPENIPQLSFDLVFEREFELSHNWKNGSVFFCGYQAAIPENDSAGSGGAIHEAVLLSRFIWAESTLIKFLCCRAEKSKKRTSDSAIKTPVPSKKAKNATPQKTDGGKAGQVTPHPSKAKAAANGNNPKTPKSGGSFSCKSCERSFGSDGALKSHSQAKHGSK